MTSNEFHPPKRRPAGNPIFILLYADIAMALSQALFSLGRATVVRWIVCASGIARCFGLVSSQDSL